MTPAQCREARKLLAFTQEDLANMADLSPETVEAFEAGHAVADCLVDALEVTLEAAGVEFDLERVKLRNTDGGSGQ